jgi:DNA repair protein RecO (recombination protein O)
MLIDSEGIVLRSVRYGDHSLIVSVYTQTEGMLSFSFRPRQGKTSIGGLLSPLSMIRVVADIKPTRSIHQPKEVSLSYHYSVIPFDPARGCLMMFFNELIIKVLKEEEPNDGLFQFLTRVLRLLDEQEPLHPSYHLSVLVGLTSFLGFSPHLSPWRPGMCFDLREGVFVHPPVGHPDLADEEMSFILNEFIRIPFEEYQQFRGSRVVRNKLLDLLLAFYQVHIEGFGSMKSVEVIRTVME